MLFYRFLKPQGVSMVERGCEDPALLVASDHPPVFMVPVPAGHPSIQDQVAGPHVKGRQPFDDISIRRMGIA